MRIEGRFVIAEKLTPRGGAVFFGISRGVTAYGGLSVQVTKQLVLDEDGDGTVQLDTGSDIPLRAVWAVVDYETGASGLCAPLQQTPFVRQLAPGSLKTDESGGAAFLAQDRSRMALLLITPRKGAWFQLGHLGGSGDVRRPDAAGKQLTLAFENASSIVGDGKDRAPRHLGNSDVLIGIDPGRLDIFVWAVGK